jgi:hypothetical protein
VGGRARGDGGSRRAGSRAASVEATGAASARCRRGGRGLGRRPLTVHVSLFAVRTTRSYVKRRLRRWRSRARRSRPPGNGRRRRSGPGPRRSGRTNDRARTDGSIALEECQSTRGRTAPRAGMCANQYVHEHSAVRWTVHGKLLSLVDEGIRAVRWAASAHLVMCSR